MVIDHKNNDISAAGSCQYQYEVIVVIREERLGLKIVESVKPDPALVSTRCCALRAQQVPNVMQNNLA